MAAMSKPAPAEALELLASGCVVAQLSADGKDVLLDTIHGKAVRDRGRMLAIAGAWPLYRAGMIDETCAITEAGRAFLATGFLSPVSAEAGQS